MDTVIIKIYGADSLKNTDNIKNDYGYGHYQNLRSG